MEERDSSSAEQPKAISRKEKRKALKKDKRKQIRKELAEKARVEEEARLNDPEVQREIQMEEEMEKQRVERERKEFEEREKIFLEELERKRKEEEDEERMNAVERESKLQLEGAEEGSNEDDEWEYVEEGPPEIIWQGNEIIVKKNKVRVKKKETNQNNEEDPNRPTSNPLPPQYEAYASFKNASMTSAQLLDTVAQQVPNFGTEQDKAHCPFHIKTGACRFGLQCNRVHYYPDKSNTLLIKNMYNGPGLAWEQDEGLEYTEEEVERCYEDFYEDVHTEFLKFGEIINFKVCRNGSFHLRGNVYVHYKSLDSAVMAYSSVHGRYFAGKQVKCEFVSLTRWKVAICGEYMKSRLKTCSRGSACNFLHCFSNPGGDYEWADCDKPPPRYWVKKMTALFGYLDEIDQPSPKDQQHSSRVYRDSYHYKRDRSVDPSQHNGVSDRSHHKETHARKSRHRERQEDNLVYEDEKEYRNNHDETGSDGVWLDRKRHADHLENQSMYIRRESKSRDNYRRTPSSHDSSSDEDLHTHTYTKRKSRHRKNVSESSNDAKTEPHEGDLLRHNQQKTKSTSRRSRHVDRDEVDQRESKKVKGHSRKQPDRSKSCESGDKKDMSDRWQPDREHHDRNSELNVKDYEMSDDRKPKDRRIDHETRSGSVVEDESKEIQHSHDHDDRPREKRKRI